MTIWIIRGLLVLWALYAFVFLGSSEEAQWGKYAFVAPAIAVLVVAEFFAWRARVKRALRALAGELGLSFSSNIGAMTLKGQRDGFTLTLRTNQNSDIGPGTHLEIALPTPTGFALGARRIQRRLRKAAPDAPQLDGLPAALGDVVAFGGPAARAFLANPDHATALAMFVSQWGGAILNDRVAGVDMADHHTKEAVAAFLDSALDIARRARSAGE
jgi:hypothetical protein